MGVLLGLLLLLLVMSPERLFRQLGNFKTLISLLLLYDIFPLLHSNIIEGVHQGPKYLIFLDLNPTELLNPDDSRVVKSG